MTEQWQYILDNNFSENERGNTWLVTEEGDNHIAWFKLDDNHFLEVAVEPYNYPGFKVNVIESTEAELAEHINTKCAGWLIRKCNVEGVNQQFGYVACEDNELVVDEDDEEYQE